ncbi:MAG: cellulase family glycosylhydrolase [Rubrobacteraceae bacterium]|nr:cellulase family glycosylhydrolase [Rubrobacteraceae bacterium]
MTAKRVLAVVLAALTSALIFAQGAAAAEPGVVPDLTWYTSESDKQRTADALVDVGSKWVRLNIQWAEAEPVNGVYNQWWLDEYAHAIDVARAANQHVIVMVDTAPVWASGLQSSNVPQDPRDYADFMGFLASRLQGKVDAYEVWNEPNLQRFWSTGPDPGRYTALLKAAYPAIKAADPAAKVIFGGTSGNDYDFIEGAYAAGAKGYFDVMATHPYPYCGSTGPSSIRREGDGRISRDSFLGYREVRATMASHGDSKPIWFTEMGWTTSSAGCNPGAGMWQGGVSEAKQAEYLTEAFQLIEPDSYVEVALWYDFRNDYWLHDSDTAEARYGLMNTDFSPKPAYAAFKAYAHGQDSATASQDSIPTATKLAVDPGPQPATYDASGQVHSADGGAVSLQIERRGKSRWKRAGKVRVPLDKRNRFARKLKGLPQGAVRIRATYRGTHGRMDSKSPYVRLRAG